MFILDGQDNVQNFQKRNDNAWQSIYESQNTVSMNTRVDVLPKNGGYLCLRNMNLRQGLTVHIEMVAEVSWSRKFKQKLYDEIKEKMGSENKYSR